jgi:hypothetical protein
MTFGSAWLTRHKSACTSGKRAVEILTGVISFIFTLHLLSYFSSSPSYAFSFLHNSDLCDLKTVKLHLFAPEGSVSNAELLCVYAPENNVS